MPDITFNCPHCSQSLAVPDTLIGNTIACPACQKSITLEADDAPPPVAVQPQPSLTIKRPPPPVQKPPRQASKPVTGPIIFDCPHCQAELEAEPDQVGTKLDCPKCSAVLTVPSQSKKPSLRTKKQSWTRKCPHCAEEIQHDAAVCRFCGVPTHPACEGSLNRIQGCQPEQPTGLKAVVEVFNTLTNVVFAITLIGGVVFLGWIGYNNLPKILATCTPTSQTGTSGTNPSTLPTSQYREELRKTADLITQESAICINGCGDISKVWLYFIKNPGLGFPEESGGVCRSIEDFLQRPKTKDFCKGREVVKNAIDEKVRTLSNPPVEFHRVHDAFIQFYKAYCQAYEAATEPSGSYVSYTQELSNNMHRLNDTKNDFNARVP